ncbi:hypothetical protein Patl1_19300 [Pistacia atlantica]|uniref:Uncharacterized protein n=1 Tax=Pistacia atlantica TaxID=434234 RepID=A0ACC1C003_9ROSI|nr:hypothetical protein Patl1_19300 [Pistacia atlantica]
MNSLMALQTLVPALNSSKCFLLSSANPPSKIFVHDFFASPSNIIKHYANSLQALRRLQPCLASRSNQGTYRPVANFAPTIWKDPNIFTSEILHSEIESNDKLAEELRQQVKEMLMASTSDPVEKLKELARAYLLEVQWFHEGFVPSFEERMENALVTGTCFYGIAALFVGMGEIVGINAFEWLQNFPKIVRAAYTIGRLRGDMVSHKQYEASREEAIEFNTMISNAWKDINKECMKPTLVSMQILRRVVNIARLVIVFYKNKDGISFPECLKDYIAKLFIEPIPI